MRRLQHLLLTLFLAGCTVGPRYEPPIAAIPDQWQSAGGECRSIDDFVWWEALNDPILNDLLYETANENLDLSLASSRIREARLEVKGKNSSLYPHLDASLTGGHLYYKDKGLIREVLGGKNRKRNSHFFEAGFDASWEIDLFGAAQHEINAAQARLEGAEEGLNDAWVTLSAEVARHYVELRSLQQRRLILLDNIESQKETLALMAELLGIGIGSSVDQLQSEGQLNLLVAQRPLLDDSIEKTMLRLSILQGKQPGHLNPLLCHPEKLPMLPCEKPFGVPSELLRRRPDIRKAERELAAATESVGTAIASLFPRLTLYGFAGDIGSQLKNLSNGSGLVWFAAPQLLLPIFNSRMLQQDVELNKIRAEEALINYQRTVLNALEEAENALASFRYESERSQFLEQAVQKDQEAYRLILDLYHRGVKDYLEVLAASRSLLASQDAYLQSRTSLLIGYIAIYKALGG